MAGIIADCDALFACLASSRGLLLAVSGGPDSVALLLLIDRWRTGCNVPVVVATVDHGLRREAATEAAAVASLCETRGLSHHVLRPQTALARTRVQERAREVRYALLARCAENVGADTIVTAHHADDQAETVLMRLTRGSGIAGLAGMAAVSRRNNLRLARPLLAVAKAELVALCHAEGVAFAEDPGNCDPRFRRAALRALGDTLSRQGLDGVALRRLAARAARAEEALRWADARVSETLPISAIGETSSIPATAFVALPAEIALRILAQRIATHTGRPAIVRLERLEALESRLRAAIGNDHPFDATLGGCTIRLRGTEVRIARAPARRQPFVEKTAPVSERRYLSSSPVLGNAGGDA